MIAGPWPRVCVVGIGNHARTKLIPAAVANGQEVAVVTRRAPAEVGDHPCFGTLDEALAVLPADTLFVLATPPALHADQAIRVLQAGRDVLVEKPAVVTPAEAAAVATAAAATGGVFAEAFMYRFTGLHRRFIADWQDQPRPDGVTMAFVIPALPPGTFRDGGGAASSLLFDIGCYPLSLLAELGLPLTDLHVSRTSKPHFELAGTLDGIAVDIRVGLGDAYANRVEVVRGTNAPAVYEPYFYGRAGLRRFPAGELEDPDAFAAMLAQPRTTWLADQPVRLARLRDVTACLDRLVRSG